MEPAISLFLWKKLAYFPAMQNHCHLVAISKTTQEKKKSHIFIKISIAAGCKTSYLAILE